MSHIPRVSVAMPVYNGDKYFELALQSVLAQTFKDIEIIIVNDGSTDGGYTESIALKYAAIDKRIKYVPQHNQGVAGALNTVVKNAEGEYFAWLSHDDLFLPHKIEAQLAYLDKIGDKNASLFSDYALIDENGALIWEVRFDPERFVSRPKLSVLGGGINGCTLLIPMHVMREHGEFDLALRYSQDYDFWNRILHKYDFFHQPELLVKYRIHSNQGTQKEGATIEGDALWIKLVEERSDIEKVQLYGSTQKYYAEMAAFLDATPYRKAFSAAKTRAAAASDVADTLVSVVIPFFNEIDLVATAVASVQGQTHHRVEIILVNDGSAEPIDRLLDMAHADERIRLINQTNKGSAEARNAGLLVATGEYIAFLDADDVFLPRKIETQLKAMKESGAMMSHTSYFVHFPGKSTKRGIGHAGRFSGRVYPRIIQGCPIATPTVMWHSTLVSEGYRFKPAMRLGEDILIWTSIAQRYDILGIDEPLSEVELSATSAAVDPMKGREGLAALVEHFKSDPLHATNTREIAALEAHLNELDDALADGQHENGRDDVLEMYFGSYAGTASATDDTSPAERRDGVFAAERVIESWDLASGRARFLLVAPTVDGSVDRHVSALTMRLLREHVDVLHCRPTTDGHLAIRPAGDDEVRPAIFRRAWGDSELAQLSKKMGISHIHVHSLVGFDVGTSDLVVDAAVAAGIGYDVTLHDYTTICPRRRLADHTGRYCGEPELIGCERCIARNDSPIGQVSVSTWREQNRRLLTGARAIFAPNEDVVARVTRHYPEVRPIVQPQPNAVDKRVALIGPLGADEGSLVVLETARAAKRGGLPLGFVIVGETDRQGDFAAMDTVETVGPRHAFETARVLADLRIDLVWIASVVPQTPGHALAAAVEAGRPCAAFDIGAVARRISELGNGRLIPLDLVDEPGEIAAALLEACGEPSADPSGFIATYYGLPANLARSTG